MVWKIDAPQGNEVGKIRWETVPYTQGTGYDLGCGPEKLWPQCIGIDSGLDEHLFGIKVNCDLRVADASDVNFLASSHADWIFSSHLLEHIVDYKKALREWWRVLKDGGRLILYLPHKSFYPNIGQHGANPDHKHDFIPEDIISAMKEIGGWDLLECQERNQDNEYSFFIVLRKTTWAENERTLRKYSPEIRKLLLQQPGAGNGLVQGVTMGTV